MGRWDDQSARWEVDWSDAEHLRKPGECNPEDSITKDVIADLREREKFGALKYGKYLTHYTTEDTMQHLYEELLDAALYIKTEMKKRLRNPEGFKVVWERDSINKRDNYTVTLLDKVVDTFSISDSFKNAEGFGKILELHIANLLRDQYDATNT